MKIPKTNTIVLAASEINKDQKLERAKKLLP